MDQQTRTMTLNNNPVTKTVLKNKQQIPNNNMTNINQNNNGIVETEDDDTETFYLNKFKLLAEMKKIDDQERFHIKQENLALKKALTIKHEEYKDVHNKNRLLAQENEFFKNREGTRNASRDKVESYFDILFKKKDQHMEKKLEEGIDDMVANILKNLK